MNKLQKIIAASTLVFASLSASASMINVGGINWDPDYDNGFITDFTSTGYFDQYYIAGSDRGSVTTGDIITDFSLVAVGDTLEGFGFFADLNGLSPADYCANCSLLSFAFTDFLLTSLTPAGKPLFTNGKAGIYTDIDGIVNSYATASADSLWLGLEAVNNPIAGTTIDVGGTLTGGTSAHAYFNVVGGAAMSNFNTNGQLFGSDLAYTSSRNAGATNGKAGLDGNTIPEPTTLAMFGLALLGLARMKKHNS
jgi:hypothetical protein